MSAPDSTPSADRNLLFGILALQMDFISRDALIQAMNAWVLQKSTPLGQILLDQGALRPDTRALLEALVQKHLEMHDGDAQKSLASISSIGSAQQQLEQILGQIADVDVKASLAHVSTRDFGEEEYKSALPPTVGAPTTEGQRFRILRPHAKGGLGEVFIAHDSELRREVALKEIQNRYADDQNSRSRFVLEAEITGGLEHPGIVPVYGLGQYADGRPFYAMRFIRGDSLQDAIRRFHKADTPGRDRGERSLALRQLLGRFVDVCDAIDYAHSRRVLHRDLKPGNIMLGKYGETLVVDWGLAKPLGSAEKATESMEAPLQPSSASGSNPTQMGSAVGTPAYMPPEQAAGRLDQLGPASDVYSLGATLYSLLTGIPPFEGKDIGAVLRQVEQGEFRPPRQVKPAVPAALEAVCLKAMALRPEDRFTSPRSLSEDIEHWLADEPVSAWREPWQVRARRWVGRHRTLVTTAAATLLVATVSLTAATILLQAANDVKEAALRQAEDNAAEARHQEQLALEQKRETEKQAAIALAVNEFLQKDLLGQADIGQQMVGPGEERDPDVKVRTLLDRAAESIEGKFKGQPLTEAAIRLMLGNTYQALGRYPESQRHLERSIRLRTANLGADHPDTLGSKHDLALLYRYKGMYDLAEPLLKEVLQVQTAKLGADHSDTLTSKKDLAVLYDHQSKYPLAEQLLKEVLQARTAKLGADHLDTLIIKSHLASLYQHQGKYALAEPFFREVLQAQTAKLGADHPDTLSSKHNLALVCHYQGKYDIAEQLYKAVIQTETAKLGADHPNALISKNCLAGLYHDQSKFDLAEPLYKEVLQAQTAKLGADHPDTLISKDNLAGLYQDKGEFGKAESLYKEVLQASTTKLGADHPDTLTSKNNLAGLYRDQGNYRLAETLFKEVLQARIAKLGADHPDTLVSKNNLGLLYLEQGKYSLAEPLFREALQASKAKLGVDHPHTLVTMAHLSLSLLRQKKIADAEPILRECLVIHDKKQPDQWTTFSTRSMLGEALASQKKYTEAEPLLLQGYEGMKQREKSIPPQNKRRLIEGLERLVQLYDAWGKKDKADDYRKKLAVERAKSPAKKK